jgi:hypothetical protein
MSDQRDQRPSKGGIARRDKLSPEKRREIALRAAQARWARADESSPVLLSELGIYMKPDVLEAADMLVGELEAQAAEWRQLGANALAQGDLARARVTIDLIERTRLIEGRARDLKSEVGTLLKSITEEKSAVLDTTASESRKQDRTDPAQMNAKRSQIIRKFEEKFEVQLRKRTEATFVDDEAGVRAVCTMSKWYPQSEAYWYAFHSHQDSFLGESNRGFVVLGMMDLNVAVVLPLKVIRDTLQYLSTTEPENGQQYWHLNIARRSDGKLMLHRARGADPVPLDQYLLRI